MKHVIGSLLVFLVIGAIMGVCRYTAFLPSDYSAMLKTYGPYTLILVHIVILLLAFKDDFYQGLLCLLVPLYSFYYLFITSDEFYLRAIVAGVLVGIGQDSALFYQDKINIIITVVQEWIASGG